MTRAAKAASAKGTGERRFRAMLEPDHTALNWTIARVPFDIHAAWSGMRRLRVRGEIDGVAFRTSLFPYPDGSGFFVLVNKTMQREAKVRVGGTAEFVLAPDLEERPCDLPAELLKVFGKDKKLLRWTEALSESMRREIAKWIEGAKGGEARARKAAAMAERLMAAMEGERETPPILAKVFARNGTARRGWEEMTPVQRRGHLLGIFYYGTPEARERRAEKAIADAVKRAKQSKGNGTPMGEVEG